MEFSSPNGIFKKAENLLKKNKKIAMDDEIVCACYLYRSIEYDDKKSYERFKEIFNRLGEEKRFQAINYYLSYVKSKNKKVKCKKK